MTPDPPTQAEPQRPARVAIPEAPGADEVQHAFWLLREFVAAWTEYYVAPPDDITEAEESALRRRLSLTHQNAERLLHRLGVQS